MNKYSKFNVIITSTTIFLTVYIILTISLIQI